MFRILAIQSVRMAVAASPAPRKMAFKMNRRMIVTLPPNMTVV